MENVAGAFLEYFRLERKRTRAGLSVTELERWSRLKGRLDRQMLRDAGMKRERARASVRVPTRLHCAFASRSDFDEAVITNLSAGGVCIATTSPLPIGERLTLQIHVAGGGASIEVEAEVVTTNVGRNYATTVPGMGVRFSHLGADTIAQIHDLYERELEREAVKQERDPGPRDYGMLQGEGMPAE